MEKVGSSIQNLTRVNNLTKFTVGICLLFASIILAIVTISQISNQANRNVFVNDGDSLKASAEGKSNFMVNESDVDLTIIGILGQRIEEFRDKLNGLNKDSNLTVKIRGQGSVRGTVLKSREGRDYFAFYQIPYAANTVGELRFKLPEKPKRWRQVRDATKIGAECIQEEKYAPIKITAGDEACLHLNVYTPIVSRLKETLFKFQLPKRRKRNSQSLPVLFYVHGGQPHGNGTRYGAKYFMDEDVVLVTFEYRLGAFSSFTTGSETLPGNLGFKDQVFALEWVKRNIKRFGGNPDNVLLFGNSGGGGAVNSHLLSPMSKDLFHRAIMESGSVFMGISRGDAIESSENFAFEVGCGNFWNDTEEVLLNCLQNVDAKVIALSSIGLQMPEGYVDNWDGLDYGRKMRRTVFMPDAPWTILHEADSEINKVPLIVSINSQEFIHGELSDYLLTDGQTRYLNEFWNDIFPRFANIKDDENHTAAQEFRQFYFGDDEIGNDTRVALFNLQSDHFIHGCRISGLLYANHTNSPVYFSWMTKEAAKSYGQKIHNVFPPPYGTAHADELQYLFLYSDYPEIGIDSPWFEFSKMMVQLWVSFAKEGKPISKTVAWPPIDLHDNGMKWFQLDDQLQIVEPFTERMKLWDKYTENMYSEL